MDSLRDLLIKQPWFRKLERRSSSYYEMIKHLDQFESGTIIETGTAWCKDNWAGQGQSTLIWDWVLEHRPLFKGLSIDMTPEHIEIARAQTKLIKYDLSDSIKSLNSLDHSWLNECRLLYLDSYDWSPSVNLESAFHHMAELACVWPNLPAQCMIVVDDRHDALRGKHWLVEAFFNKLGIAPVFCDYQIGWVK